ncbi:MAG: LptF/LptG family permease [Bacteroidales bacterium]
MLKRIDIYIIKKFLGTYFFAIALILAIAVVFDFNEKMDSFIRNEAPVRAIIVDYYFNFIPYFANLFSPLFVFIAVIFFTSQLADNSEVIAMLASGMSFKRLMRPYMISAAIIAIVTFALNSFIIPPSNVVRIAFQNKYVKNKEMTYARNSQLMVEPGVIAYMERFDNTIKTGYRFSLEKFDDKKLVSRLTAKQVKYDSAYRWEIKDYMIRNFDGMVETIEKGAKLDTIIRIEPTDILVSRYDSEIMNTPTLKRYIDRQKQRGVANIKDFEIEYHKRFAAVAAAFILTAIGMSLSSRKVKGGMGLNIGLGLALSFSYILFMTVSSTFAVTGKTSAFIAVWIPNFVYTLIAIYLYRKAPK